MLVNYERHGYLHVNQRRFVVGNRNPGLAIAFQSFEDWATRRARDFFGGVPLSQLTRWPVRLAVLASSQIGFAFHDMTGI